MKKPDAANGTHAPHLKSTNGSHAPSAKPEPAPVPTAPPAVKSQNIIGKGTVIEGNITTDGDLRLEGTIKGDVTTKTTLIVAQGCLIEGNLVAQHAEIAGQVHGTVTATGLLTIKSTGVIDGDVITANLNVEAGSAFTGRFQVGSTKSDANSVLG